MATVWKIEPVGGGTAYATLDDSGNLSVSGTLSSTGVDDFGASGIKSDVIAESTSAAGVTIDGMLVKDRQIDVSALASGEPGVKLPANGADAYSIYDGTGDVLTITTTTNDLSLNLPDNVDLNIGTGDDLSIVHDGTLTTITSATGDLVIDNTDTNDQIILRVGTDTTATGVEIRNNSDVAVWKIEPTSATAGRLMAADGSALVLGAGSDDSVAHDGTDTTWTHTTGDLVIDNTAATKKTALRLGTDTSATAFEVRNDSNTALFSVGGDGAAVVSGSLRVTGRIVATGTSALVDAEHIDLRANYLLQNTDYTTAVAVTGGRVVNYLPTATADTTVGAGVVTAGVDGVSDPTITTAGVATFAATDLVMISNSANNGENDGLVEVASHAANVLTLKSTSSGITNRVEDFTLDQLVANAGDVGMTLTKVTVSVDRVGTDGRVEHGSGSQTGIAYADFIKVGDSNPSLVGLTLTSTLDQNAIIDQDTADTTGTGAALDSLGTSTSATGSYAIVRGTFQQITNAKTAGVGFGVQGTYTGLAGDTSGALVGGLYAAAPTLNGGSATDAGLAIAAGYTNDIYFVDDSAVVTVQDGQAAALTIQDSAGNDFLVIDTVAADGITLGNAATNPVITVLGTGGTDVSAGPLTVGAGSVSGTLTVLDGGAIALRGAGTGTGDVVEQIGTTPTEAFRLVVYDQIVSPAAVETNLINLPAGSMLVSVQANVQAALTGGGTTATWSIGTAADPDKYGSAGFNSIDGSAAADSLAQNSKSTWFGDASHAFSLSSAAEQLVLTGCATGGAADGDTALTVGSVRVRVIYWQLQALDNA